MSGTSARAQNIYDRLGRGTISEDAYRPLHGELMDVLVRGRQPGEYVFPTTTNEGRSRHDYNIGGFSFSIVQQDDGTWHRVDRR